MSLVFIRSLHYKRVPNYEGWWTQILNRANDPVKKVVSVETRVPLQIPFAQVIEPIEKPIVEPPKVYHLKGKPVEIPSKPEAPDNCCMR
jgi:hypothetical protein